jgi:hypothetical protein
MSSRKDRKAWREKRLAPRRRHAAEWLLLLPAAVIACALTLGCGGTQAATVDGGVPAPQSMLSGPLDPDPCDASSGFIFHSIANFNDGDAAGGPYSAYVSYDTTGTLFTSSMVSGRPPMLVPVMGIDPVSCVTGYQAGIPADKLPTSRCGTDPYALHLLATGSPDGGGQLTGWGMNVSVDLRQNCTGQMEDAGAVGQYGPCYLDATGWTGVSFWALLDPLSTGAVALATVADPNTAGVLGGIYPFNELTCGNPPCVAGQPQINTCTAANMPLCLCDPLGKAVGLVNHWAFYTLPFSEMRQKGYGMPVSSIDLKHFLGFKFSLGKGAWDLWLDDISLYKPKGP